MTATDPRPSTRGKARKNKRNRTTLKRIESAKRVEQIMNLRRQGWSLEKIGEELRSERNPRGIGKSRVHAIITEYLDKTVRETTEQVRQLELDRLDELQAAWYEKAKAGDPVAVDKVAMLLSHRARLLGLNAPVRVERSGKDGADQTMTVRVIEDAALAFDTQLAMRIRARFEQRAAQQRTAAEQQRLIDRPGPEGLAHKQTESNSSKRRHHNPLLSRQAPRARFSKLLEAMSIQPKDARNGRYYRRPAARHDRP